MFLRLVCLVLFVSAPLSSAVCANENTEVPLLLKRAPERASVRYELQDISQSVPGTFRRELLNVIKSETAKISEAIYSLKKPDESIWQQLQPYVLTFISTLLALVSAIAVFYWQERFKVHQENLRIANKWLLAAVDVLTSLERYKRIYSPRIFNVTDPLKRIFSIPEIYVGERAYHYELAELVFVMSTEEDETHWDDLFRIHALFENYRLVNFLWQKHTEEYRNIRRILLDDNEGQPFHQVRLDVVKRLIEPNRLVNYVLLGEQAIKLSDDLIVEAHSMMANFPRLVSRRLKRNRFFKLGPLITPQNDTGEKLASLLAPSFPVDIGLLVAFTGYPRHKIEERLATGYPFIPREKN